MGSESKKWPVAYKLFPSVRLLMIFLTYIGIVSLTNSVYSVGFSLVCMVNTTAIPMHGIEDFNQSILTKLHNTSRPAACVHLAAESDNVPERSNGPFNWDKRVQANLLAGFSWGAVILQIPTGWLLDRYGARYVFAGMQSVAAVTTALAPLAASASHWAYFSLRVVQGLCCSGGWAVMTAVCARWSPNTELGISFTLISLGSQCGYFLAMFTSGYICASSIGWSGIFYIQTGMLALSLSLWLLLYRDKPEDVSFISQTEISFVKASRSYRPIDPEIVTHEKKDLTIPWKTLFLSSAVFAILVGQATDSWISYFVAQYLPAYMKEVLFLDLRTNGLLSSLPFLAQIAGRLIAGPISDKLETIIPSTLNVKLFNTISTGIPALVLLSMALFVSCGQTVLAVFLMCLSHFFFAMIVLGCYRSLVLIAPAFSGTICAMGQFLGFITGIALPYMMGEITKEGHPAEWKIALLISSAIASVGMVVFLVWGSGREQAWSRPPVEFGPLNA